MSCSVSMERLGFYFVKGSSVFSGRSGQSQNKRGFVCGAWPHYHGTAENDQQYPSATSSVLSDSAVSGNNVNKLHEL